MPRLQIEGRQDPDTLRSAPLGTAVRFSKTWNASSHLKDSARRLPRLDTLQYDSDGSALDFCFLASSSTLRRKPLVSSCEVSTGEGIPASTAINRLLGPPCPPAPRLAWHPPLPLTDFRVCRASRVFQGGRMVGLQ